ncbi:MAG: Ig-like domain-containing protein, partial [Acidimicrobiia bacterium]
RAAIAFGAIVAIVAIIGGGWLYANTQVDTAGASGTFLRSVPKLTVTSDPADGAVDVRPDATVTVTAKYGQIVAAELLDDADVASVGVIAPDGSAWSSAGSALATGSHYRVNLQIQTPRGVKNRITSFTTLTPTATMSARVSPGDDETVGVGQPIIVRFSDPVANKAAVEQRLVVTPSTPVVGSWHWFGDMEVHYRPQQYWPANITVDTAANLAGVDFGDGVWGDQNITTHFMIGNANVSTVDLQTHRMIVTTNGQQVADIPISAGKDGFPTMTGTLLVLNKAAHVVMDSSTNGIPLSAADGYRTDVQWATRLTNTGIYVHAAPWSVGSQGSANVSHGCVNVSDEWGKWFYDLSQPGDVVTITGGPRPPSSTDAGSRDWNMSWDEWIAGSALTGLPIS